jgi:hypothetical protein
MNQNLPSNFHCVDKVDVYFLDPHQKTPENVDGRTFVSTIPDTSVINSETGNYYIDLFLEGPLYVIGNYLDIWTVTFKPTDQPTTIENNFTIYPDLWTTTVIPVVYDFNFNFQPNRLIKGSKQWLIIEVIPNVPRATDLQRYYISLAILGDLKISIAEKCGPCTPKNEDSRLIIDQAPMDFREKVFGYYKINTEDFDCGLFDVWFTLETGGNTYISPKNQLLIYN